ncbi:MAG: M28 family peptidase [Bacteroidales bacterium]
MTRSVLQHIITLFTIGLLLNSCSGDRTGNNRQPSSDDSRTTTQVMNIPEFNADSAYHFVAKQVSFGPRVPNTAAHEQCGDWLQKKLTEFADTVYVQRMRLRAWDGTLLNARNLIGSYGPSNRNRILLCAHWDTRPWADRDPDPANHFKPFDGANDGASGVGVLLEIARILNQNPPAVGVDIIFFDAEDYGHHEQARSFEPDSWALGSQFWASNPHKPDYFARYGILLDMVGAYNPTFKKEGYSMMYAPNIVRRVWNIASRAGFGHLFINEPGGHIIDDHYYINEIRGIPTINIIDQRSDTPHGFFPYWHTMKDNMEAIDKNTLHAVGTTVLWVLFDGN